MGKETGGMKNRMMEGERQMNGPAFPEGNV
jgi:hypothetical protein